MEVVDSAAQAFHAVLRVESHGVSAKLRERIGQTVGEPAVRIAVAQAIPRGQKMDYIVEKLTELGVHTVMPFNSQRSVVTNVGENKVERWRRIAKTAAQQCGRRHVLSVAGPLRWKNLMDQFLGYDRTLLPWEVAAQTPLQRKLPRLLKDVSTVLIVIGPEGGFSHDEIDEAVKLGAKTISLGARIFRTETAALVLCSIVNYLTGTS